jgi:hypothetical protein
LKIRENSQDIVSCIIHEGGSKTIFEKKPINKDLIHEMLKYKVSSIDGSNSFIKAMLEIRNVVKNNSSNYTPIVFFMTDGAWSEDGCSKELSSIMNDYKNTG